MLSLDKYLRLNMIELNSLRGKWGYYALSLIIKDGSMIEVAQLDKKSITGFTMQFSNISVN